MDPFSRSQCVPYNGDGRARSEARGRSLVNRHPVTQQRYAIRRLGVATVLALGVFGAVRVVSSLTENKAAGEAPPSSLGDSSTTVAATGVPVADPTTVAPTTPPPPTERSGPPTEDNPAQVLVVGDSDAGVFGPYLQNVVEEWDVVDVELDFKASTGLARPDFYDWPSRLRQTLSGTNPDVIVVSFGGNDAQGISEPCSGGEGCDPDWVIGQPSADNKDEWTAEYVQRVNEIIGIMLEGNPDRAIIWVGIPNAAAEEFTGRLQIQDRAVRQALEAYPQAVFVDTWAIFDGINGGIAELVVDPRTGEAIPVRAADGFHLNSDGADILAIKVSDRVRTALEALGAEF